MSDRRQLHLNLFGNWYGNHRASWRHPKVDPHQVWSLDFSVKVAQTAERGLFDAIFFADGPGGPELHPGGGHTRPEPITLLSAIAASTEYIGLASTVSTTYSEPYNTARQIASLDQISGGRAGWNAVTGSQRATAKNFGPQKHPDKALRYERSEEFIQIVRALWESWEPDAVIGDQESGVFIDPSKVRRVPFKGKHFEIDAVFGVPRSSQGRPMLFHAGDSDFGRSQGARYADAIFTAQPTIEFARRFYDDFKRRVVVAGRPPEESLVIPGYLPIIGSTEAEAKAALQELNDLIDYEWAVEAFASSDGGLDLRGEELDRPVRDEVWNRALATTSFGSRVQVLRDKADEANLTAREVMQWNIAAHGHFVHVGTPEQIADEMERWLLTGATDGFNYKAPIFPEGLEIFVDHVIPLLQQKGIFRHEYEEKTLRGHYGLPVPAPSIRSRSTPAPAVVEPVDAESAASHTATGELAVAR